MKKTVIIILTAILAILVIAACGTQPTNSLDQATTTIAVTTTEWRSETTAEESSAENTEAETSAVTSVITATSSTAAPKPAEKAVNSTASPTTTRPAAAKSATAKASVVQGPVTAAQATTMTRYVSPQTAAPTTTTKAPQTQAPRAAYTAADCEEIVAAVKAYAEAKTKVRFILKPDLRYDGPIVSYHDVVNLSQSSGKAFVINELKYHTDLTEHLVSGGSGGVPGDAVYYNVVYFDYEGSTMFVLLYT